MQEKALQLMGSKLEASLAIEGKFTEEGLVAMTSGEDMTTALAKALVDGLETEGIEQIWRKINQKNKAQRAMPFTEERIQSEVKVESEKTEDDPNRMVVIEFTKFISRRKKQIERVEVKASELKKIIKEKGQSAQLSLF
jgi:PP-loop superfamily ATP-utilizing enzyme